jgi:regulator of protease activity HflC (stomatin/prohibitin superfamily)
MVNYISTLVFFVLMGLGLLVVGPWWTSNPALGTGALVAWLIADIVLSSAIQLAAQWERAVVFRLGRFQRVRGPGLFTMIPLVDQLRMIDTRVLAVDIPKQQVMTRDNVPVAINAVLFYKVICPELAVIEVQDYRFAISQYAQTSLRDVIGQMSLDQLLTEREQIAESIEQNVMTDIVHWGLEVTGLRLQDIEMPEDLKRIMSRQASAEREKRATITKAEGDREAAANLAEAAATMARSPGAMQLRTLQSIDSLGPSASNTVVLAIPIDVFQALGSVSQFLGAGTGEETGAAVKALGASTVTPLAPLGASREEVLVPRQG